MAENIVPIPLPHQEREQVLSPAHFLHALSERGWTVTHRRPTYTDPEVFRQQWLVCPNGASYPERTFYRAFGSTYFRKLLRYALSHVPCTRDVLEQVCPQQSVFSSSLTFLQDQEWFHFRGRWLEQGPYQAQISNIGRTLEWYVAEWFRLTFSASHLASVHHGVQLAELPLPGDLDVIALLNDELLVMVECKSASEVDEAHCILFLQRVQAFHPDIAILLIDTPAAFAQARIAAFNRALKHLGYSALVGGKGLYWGPMSTYVVNVETSLAVSLRDVLRFHQQRAVSHTPI